MKMTLIDQVLILALIAAVGTFTGVAKGQATQVEQAPKQEEKSAQEKPAAEKPAAESAAETAKDADATAGSGSKDSQETKTPEPFEVSVARNKIKFSASGTWAAVRPRSRMLESELRINRIGNDAQDGRLTIMGAGGTIEANITRWQGQFKQADGGSTADVTKTEVKTIAGQKVNLVDISGNFIDSPGGPFSGKPKVERENYRMLAAIIQTPENGNYFVKLYGPKATIDKNEEHFKSMIDSLKIVK